MGYAVQQALGAAFAAIFSSQTVKFVLKVVAVTLLSAVSSKLFRERVPEVSRALRARQVMTRSAVEYRKIVYGRALVSGPIVYNNLSGDSNEYLWFVIALCQGESDSIEAVWFDGDEIPAADINWDEVANSGGRQVSTAKWVGDNSVAAVLLSWRLGLSAQVAPFELTSAFAQWTSNHRLRGVTYLMATLLYNVDTENVWKLGEPRDIKALVKGRKVYDSRKFSLLDDPDFLTVGRPVGQTLKWFGDVDQTTELGAEFSSNPSQQAVYSTDNDNDIEWIFSEQIPVDTAKTYTVRVDARQTSGDRINWLGVSFYDANGDEINSTSVPVSDATGWASVGTKHWFHVGATMAANWTEYSESFGPGGDADIPTGAVSMAFVAALTATGTTSSVVGLRDAAIFEGLTRQEFETPTTWAWSENPWPCIGDYLTQVMGVAYDSVDWSSFNDAANDCDPLVAIPTASTEKRFTCNGVVSLGDSHKNNLDALLSSCDGRLAWSGGKWKGRASVWDAPDITITEDDLVGDIEVRGSSPKRERWNTVYGDFVDADRQHQVVEFPRVSSATYIARDDGKEISKSLRLPMTNSATMAQRIAYRLLKQSDQQKLVSINVNRMGLQIAIGQTVSVDFPSIGWSAAGNLLKWSESAENWNISGGTVTSARFPTGRHPTGRFPAGRFPQATGDASVTVDGALSPAATAAADMVTANSTGNVSLGLSAGAVGDDTGMLFAVYAKAGQGANAFRLRNNTGAVDLVRITIDYDTGDITYVSTQYGYAFCENVVGGWLRVILIASGDQITNGDVIECYAGFDGSAATSGDFFYFWGAQLVAGQQIPSYVRTAASPVTGAPKVCRVIEWARNSDGTYRLGLRDDVSTVYDDPLESEYGSLPLGGVAIPSDSVPAPTGLTATGVDAGIKLAWTNPPAATFDYVEIYESSDSAWANASKIAEVRTNTYTVPLDGGTTRWYWIRAVRVPSLQSARLPDSDTSTITATARGAVSGGIAAIGASLTDVAIDPDDAEVAFRVDADGDVYTQTDFGGAFGSIGTWLLSGANTDYDVGYFNVTGDTPTGSLTETWLAANADRTWTLTETVLAGAGKACSGTLKWRDSTTLEVLGQATVDMTVDVDV